MKKLVSLLLTLSMLFALCACGGSTVKELPATIIDNEGNTVEMTHDELLQVNKDNQLKFEKLYGGADITFIGTVKNIKTEIYAAATGVLSSICWDEIYFEEGWKVLVHHGSYDDILMQLSAGDKLQVESQIYYAFISVEITGCDEYGSKGNDGLKMPILTLVN
ncbi:MAG: hypothetical protein IJD81_00085 [Oscillospiraceae bacterium]|nr:hypothetical protein [Oscillospiraceae bacterium]